MEPITYDIIAYVLLKLIWHTIPYDYQVIKKLMA